MDFAGAVTFEQIRHRAPNVAAEGLEGFALDVQAFDIRVLHVPDARVIIACSLDDCDAHIRIPSSGNTT